MAAPRPFPAPKTKSGPKMKAAYASAFLSPLDAADCAPDIASLRVSELLRSTKDSILAITPRHRGYRAVLMDTNEAPDIRMRCIAPAYNRQPPPTGAKSFSKSNP